MNKARRTKISKLLEQLNILKDHRWLCDDGTPHEVIVPAPEWIATARAAIAAAKGE